MHGRIEVGIFDRLTGDLALRVGCGLRAHTPQSARGRLAGHIDMAFEMLSTCSVPSFPLVPVSFTS